MKRIAFLILIVLTSVSLRADYVPAKENLESRQTFEGFRFGIFLHWGIYSEFAQGEWYLNNKLNKDEYAKAATCFYPLRFNASEWVRAIKESGAKYITFTSRHHDGFSMFKTAESKYNIVDGTPFGRDVVGELADACHAQGVRLHLYYSILDWIREDYPLGRTGRNTGRTPRPNYDSYFQFMKNQVRELLMNYKDIGGIWLDGYWDHDADSIPFDWRMPEFYRYIHQLKPGCLIGNNHHSTPIEGEDFQMFECDLPGENNAGMSGQEISRLPLETCLTMNGMWGYKVADQNYKPVSQLIQTLAKCAAKGGNLLLNIGPQPNGELPQIALDRLKGIGQWMKVNGRSIYETKATDLPEQDWGVTTQKDNSLFLHVLKPSQTIAVSLDKKPKKVVSVADTTQKLTYKYDKRSKQLSIGLPEGINTPDFVIEVVR